MLKYIMVAVLMVLPISASAADKWVPIRPAVPPLGPTLLNVGYVVLNGDGNRVATLRSMTEGGFKMDVLTEFDCLRHRQHALSSTTTDKDGHLIVAGGEDKTWFSGDEALGLAVACNAPVVKPD